MPYKYRDYRYAAKEMYRMETMQYIKEGILFTCVLLLLLAFLFVSYDTGPYDIDMLYGTIDLEAYELDDEPIYLVTDL